MLCNPLGRWMGQFDVFQYGRVQQLLLIDHHQQQQEEEEKIPIFNIFVAATAVLTIFKRIEVTCQTHHRRRPLWSNVTTKRYVLTCANHRQTDPQKSICSSHHRTYHK